MIETKSTYKNLFGDVVTVPDGDDAKATKRKRSNAPKGYPAPKGSGPDGETCRTCENACRVNGGSKYYWKCGLLRHAWTRGLGTDIRLKAPACSHWQAKQQPHTKGD